MKRLKFKESNFQPIFFEENKEYKNTFSYIKKSYSPFALYLTTYIILLDLNSYIHRINLLTLFGVGSYMYMIGKSQ
jgi:hypothetical protein